ncbi:formate dehydrogenase accessory sulfurtransferase FdhD [Methanooceanicella nereidis]|uniref:formate dehydrogenase accessory sulfurtransferase FdhD n=1 Tax=Methanooceanicella nereidis TaxID=2052831 RepID=UPI001E59AAF2
MLDICGDVARWSNIEVCPEKKFRILLNGKRVASFMATPDNIEALAYGHLFCEGFIGSIGDVISFEPHDSSIDVLVGGDKAGQASCDFFDPFIEVSIDHKILYHCRMRLEELAKIARMTGATHCSAIFTPYGGIISYAEDEDRHCAVDKAVGKAVLNGVDLNGSILMCTGRASAGMVRKARRANIPVFITWASPSSKAVELARKFSMTLVSFPFMPKIDIYSGEERITGLEDKREKYARLMHEGLTGFDNLQ